MDIKVSSSTTSSDDRPALVNASGTVVSVPEAADDRTTALRGYYDALAPDREAWKRKNRYYHREVERLVAFLVPPGRCVLEIGCGPGDLLAAVRPARGVGIDLSPAMVNIARAKYPRLDFRAMDVATLDVEGPFDYVIMSDVLGDLTDVGAVFERLHRVARPDTRVVITYYNHLWEPILGAAARVGLKTRQVHQNWLHLGDIENLLSLSDWECVRRGHHLLLPKGVPLVAPFVNRYGTLVPVLNRLSLVQWMVARPAPSRDAGVPGRRVSVVIPCKNEAGNIPAAVERLPALGDETEIVFVDGNSTDGTIEAIEREIQRHPERTIRLVPQGDGRGKGDAVRKGFEAATGDILMILDADLTVAPEELPKFYRALVAGKGELINGTRLVYPMEQQAMRFLNFIANKLFGVLFSWLLGQRITDTLCGTKVLFKRDYERIKAGRAYFGDFDPFGDFDLLFGAARLNLKLADLPVRYHDRTYGDTKISRFRHGLLLVRMCGIALKRLKLMR